MQKTIIVIFSLPFASMHHGQGQNFEKTCFPTAMPEQWRRKYEKRFLHFRLLGAVEARQGLDRAIADRLVSVLLPSPSMLSSRCYSSHGARLDVVHLAIPSLRLETFNATIRGFA